MTYGAETGSPPIPLRVGTNELLLDDSLRPAERAREADVDVILDITAGVPHVFQVRGRRSYAVNPTPRRSHSGYAHNLWISA